MKPVTKYEARDGKLCDTEAGALRHEAFLDLVAELEDSPISWRDTSAWDVAEWLVEHYTVTRKEVGTRKGEAFPFFEQMVKTFAANVDNQALTDEAFRQFVRNCVADSRKKEG